MQEQEWENPHHISTQSEKDIVRAKLLPDGTVVQIFPDGSTQPLQGQTDWERVKSMTEVFEQLMKISLFITKAHQSLLD